MVTHIAHRNQCPKPQQQQAFHSRVSVSRVTWLVNSTRAAPQALTAAEESDDPAHVLRQHHSAQRQKNASATESVLRDVPRELRRGPAGGKGVFPADLGATLVRRNHEQIMDIDVETPTVVEQVMCTSWSESRTASRKSIHAGDARNSRVQVSLPWRFFFRVFTIFSNTWKDTTR